MVALNHAIAAAMVHGPRAGLELLTTLDADERVAGHYRLDAVRAHLLEMAGDLRARSRTTAPRPTARRASRSGTIWIKAGVLARKIKTALDNSVKLNPLGGHGPRGELLGG